MHTQQGNTPPFRGKTPPLWLISACGWLWQRQRFVWIAIFVDVGYNVVATLITTPFPWSSNLHNSIIGWMIEYWPISIVAGIILFLLETILFYVGHYNLPNQAWPPNKTKNIRKGYRWFRIITVIVILAVPFMVISTLPAITHALYGSGIGIHYTQNQVQIGICDGSCTFDTHRLDGQLKSEAQDAFNHQQHDQACLYWNWAASYDTTDAEAKIYTQDQCNRHTSAGYITFIAVVSLPQNMSQDTSTLDHGRDLLQGLYVKQKEYNDSHPNSPQIRLLIANIDNPSALNTNNLQLLLADQIKQAVAYDPSIVSIIGLPFGLDTLVSSMGSFCIPMISIAPKASNTDASCYRSVAPALQDEAQAAVDYINTTWPGARISVVIDEGDTYSEALATAFENTFNTQLVSRQPYAEGNLYSLSNVAQNIETDNPTLVYFTGPAEDAGFLLLELQKAKHIPLVMGGNNMYQFVHVPRINKTDFDNVYFTSYGYPDEWEIQHIAHAPAFYQDYEDAFDADRTHSGYTYTRADSTTMLAYDAISLLIDACNKASSQPLSSALVWHALQQYTPGPKNEFDGGISGQLSYLSNSNSPYQKAVLMLQIQDEKTHSIQVQKGYYIQN